LFSRRRLTPGAKWTAAFILIAFFASGCATPVGIKHVDDITAYRAQNANVLSSGKPSVYSMQLLERNALVGRYQKHPEQVLAELYSGLGKPDEQDRLFTLAELSFAHAEAMREQSYYLSSVVFAYAFLFPENLKDAPDAYDPRLRLAVDLYNQGLANGLTTKDGSQGEPFRKVLEHYKGNDLPVRLTKTPNAAQTL
jgi:hypothetical protein